MEFEANPGQPVNPLISSINLSDKQINNTDSFSNQYNSVRISGVNRIEIPQFLLKQMPLGEKYKILNFLFCLFICSDKRKKISSIKGGDLETYYTTKASLLSNYNPNNPEHEKSLSFLYLSALKAEYNNLLISEEWKTIGFETSNPRNELQNGGYFAVLFITYFIKKYRDEFNSILSDNKDINNPTFDIAKCAISSCFYAKIALDIFLEPNISEILQKRNHIKKISIIQFSNFTYYQNRDQNYIYDVLAKVLLYAREEIKREKKVTIERKDEIYKKSFNEVFYDQLNISPDIISESDTSFESSSIGIS